LLGISDGADQDKVTAGAKAAMAEFGVPGRVLVLHADLQGLTTDRT
jgi:hypothetical protein